jgi:hypothetical protein
VVESVKPPGRTAPQQQEDADALLDELADSAVVEASPSGSVDERAQKEAISLEDGLDLEVKRREHDRHQKFRDHANNAVLMLLWLIVGMLLLGIVVFAIHALTPWHFLSPSQLDDLKGMLATAILSSALTGYANRRMS